MRAPGGKSMSAQYDGGSLKESVAIPMTAGPFDIRTARYPTTWDGFQRKSATLSRQEPMVKTWTSRRRNPPYLSYCSGDRCADKEPQTVEYRWTVSCPCPCLK